jgi:hypothetical protein
MLVALVSVNMASSVGATHLKCRSYGARFMYRRGCYEHVAPN